MRKPVGTVGTWGQQPKNPAKQSFHVSTHVSTPGQFLWGHWPGDRGGISMLEGSGMLRIADPYVPDYTPTEHLLDFAEEKRVTRLCIMTIAELPGQLRVENDVLVVPDNIPEELKERMIRYEGSLRWTAGKPATHWLRGGPANFPEGVDPTQRTGADGLAAE